MKTTNNTEAKRFKTFMDNGGDINEFDFKRKKDYYKNFYTKNVVISDFITNKQLRQFVLH